MKLKKLIVAALTAASVLVLAAVPVKADHSHCYDFYGRCGCGHYCMLADHSRGYGYGYGCYGYYGYGCYPYYGCYGYPVVYQPVTYVPVPAINPVTVPAKPVTVPAVAPVPVVSPLPIVSTAVTMTNGMAVAPVAATISTPKDAANQVATANATAALLGKKVGKTGNTYTLTVSSGYKATGVPQTVKFPLASTGISDKSNVYAVYWNAATGTQTLAVTVDSLGYASFVAPNMTGTTIVTFYTCK